MLREKFIPEQANIGRRRILDDGEDKVRDKTSCCFYGVYIYVSHAEIQCASIHDNPYWLPEQASI